MADKKDDLPWGADGFRLKSFRIRTTVRRKTKKSVGIVRCDLPCDADGFRLKKTSGFGQPFAEKQKGLHHSKNCPINPI